MGRELDRSKGAGRTHDAERDPGHWVSLADDGSVVGVLPLADLPDTREQYDTLLRAKGSTQYKAGYLPYAIVDGWQQLRKDFAYWRATKKGAETALSAEERAWFEADRRLREQLILRDIGVWSHYVGDASQPLHVSVHYEGWGAYPNPNGYTNRDIDAQFEGEFVRDNLVRSAIAAKVGPYRPCGCSIEQRTKALLLATLAQVEPLYALEKEGGLERGDRRGIAFADEETCRRRYGGARHDRRRLARQRRRAGRLSDGERAGYRKRENPSHPGAVQARLDALNSVSCHHGCVSIPVPGNRTFHGIRQS